MLRDVAPRAHQEFKGTAQTRGGQPGKGLETMGLPRIGPRPKRVGADVVNSIAGDCSSLIGSRAPHPSCVPRIWLTWLTLSVNGGGWAQQSEEPVADRGPPRWMGTKEMMPTQLTVFDFAGLYD